MSAPARQVAIIELQGSLLLEALMMKRSDSNFVTYVLKIEELEVAPDLQELSGPPKTWHTALEDAKILEIRPTYVEDQFVLLIQSPSLREVPAGFLIPRLQVTVRKVAVKWLDSQ